MKAILILALVLVPVAGFADDILPARIVLSTAVVGLGVADLALTIHGTTKLGLVEGNPLFKRMVERRQWTALWALELGASALIVGGSNFMITRDDEISKAIGWTLLVTAAVVRGVVVLHNMKLHRRAGTVAVGYSFSF